MKATLDDILPRKPISLVAMDSFAAFRGGSGSGSTVDLAYIKTQARWHLECGVDMVILQGTTGEWPSLSMAERLDMATAWREVVPYGSPLKLLLHIGHDALVEAKRLAEHALALRMDAVLISAPSKYVAHTMSHQADAVVDILSHCGATPAFYYHYPEIYGDGFNVHELLTAITIRAERAGLTDANLVGAKLSIGPEPAGALVHALSVSGEGWGLGVGLLDPAEFWALPAMRSIIVFSWECALWRKAIDAFERGDVEAASAISGRVAAARKAAHGSLQYVTETANYQIQAAKVRAVMQLPAIAVCCLLLYIDC